MRERRGTRGRRGRDGSRRRGRRRSRGTIAIITPRKVLSRIIRGPAATLSLTLRLSNTIVSTISTSMMRSAVQRGGRDGGRRGGRGRGVVAPGEVVGVGAHGVPAATLTLALGLGDTRVSTVL